MRKIGILTYYHDSVNYGGNLQAYALCKKLEKMGYSAEQICFDPNAPTSPSGIKEKIIDRLRRIKNAFRSLRITKDKNKSRTEKVISDRKKAFEHFNKEMISHSEKVYVSSDIAETNEKYQCFIAGSDQIWNPKWYVPSYFLDFVKADNIKTSYATSFGITEFSSEQKELIKKHLNDFAAVSLREDCGIYKELFGKEVEVCVDPTLLLSREEWLEVTAPKMIDEKYIFCYFFGDDCASRKIAMEYSIKNKIKIVTIPHLNGVNVLDDYFGDIQMPSASPEEFLSLINNAECVFTDSFHAVVFSQIFKRKYFVFQRNKKDVISSRIFSITKLFNSEKFFCYNNERLSMDYIESVPCLDYSIDNENLNLLIKKSELYLHNIVEMR